MKGKLGNLYELQLIDKQLDELEELRGDLPLIVNELNAHMEVLQNNIDAKAAEKEEAQQKRVANDDEISKLGEKLKKYKAQLFKVRNNKEYDALTKEIDFSETNILEMEEENKELENRIGVLSLEIEEIQNELNKMQEEFAEKEDELKKIIGINQKEEAHLNKLREAVVEKIRKPDYNTYMRIRKAKGGIAIAPVYRGSCSGCHNVIPPQRQLEIKQNNRLFTCEACGRILVSAEIAKEIEANFKNK
jgi:predicted  nucleic acid-binding Zn-ribbon protein